MDEIDSEELAAILQRIAAGEGDATAIEDELHVTLDGHCIQLWRMPSHSWAIIRATMADGRTGLSYDVINGGDYQADPVHIIPIDAQIALDARLCPLLHGHADKIS